MSKQFYAELFDWYESMVNSQEVCFPNELENDTFREAAVVKAEQIIRLITRLLFVWFIKQKNLVPNKFFDKEKIKTLLKDFTPTGNESTFYPAILQNLFFATLNSEVTARAFARDEGWEKNRETHNIGSLYRYEKMFAIPEKQILEMFRPIPFLNGGLFECLDRRDAGIETKRDKTRYYDGFSRNEKKRARIPNHFFFGDKGILPLLMRYNFTVEENTPLDKEVALDPELLGQIFENLLAAYNPETKTTARNATGSFYTPREIVQYMVDESLKAYLQTAIQPQKAQETQKTADSHISRGDAEGAEEQPTAFFSHKEHKEAQRKGRDERPCESAAVNPANPVILLDATIKFD